VVDVETPAETLMIRAPSVNDKVTNKMFGKQKQALFNLINVGVGLLLTYDLLPSKK
jgi:hypothetical protein